MVVAEGAGEVVAGAEGHDAEEPSGLGREAGESPDRAVAAAGQDTLAAVEGGARDGEAVGERLGDVDVDGARRELIAQAGKVMGAPTATRTGIHDSRPAHGAGW